MSPLDTAWPVDLNRSAICKLRPATDRASATIVIDG
jgi:hypothetical protein